LVGGDAPIGVLLTRGQEARRTKQATDVVGPVWRCGPEHSDLP
ncbi:MAG: hypothetical protein K0S88_2094, partial [Actinomycetia bacterium]|nr:hypothetical protein [Actinomycetes bacterium]